MTRTPLIASAVAIALALAAGAFWWRPAAPARAAAASAPRSDDARPSRDVQQEIGALRGEVAALRAAVGTARAAENPVPEAAGSESKTPVTPDRHPPSVAEVGMRLDDYFDKATARDPAWDRTAESALARMVDAERMAGSSVQRAECRGTLCRVEVGHADAQAHARFVEALPDALPFNGAMFFRPGEDPESPATIVFVTREGHRMPSL